ncbi:hypothetical protein RchiOBHm_Chr1g0376021 [Rosa chinensis]|uniref:Uncharacterized protein n=1 Tax=Rosa chinensis TaxID=74649 RepID=A0A2P6SMS8_ROSCH|nr:hypothetical protein RchiOBHm_Chr1g0376021 [Rosa chinensis]
MCSEAPISTGDAGYYIYIEVVYLVMIIASPNLEVHELDELPEQWRRFKLAWLCNELLSHNSGALFRILNAQKKWMRQEDTKNSGKRTLEIAG